MTQSENILNLIPQRPPFVMVEKLISADETKAESSFTITEDNVLTEAGYLSEAGIIENIAQTAALQAGYVASEKGVKTPLGMIGGIKNLEIESLPGINSTIHTMVSVEHEVMNAKIVKGTVYLNNELIAECEIKVFLV
jgi:predicted hotdog family 3-hydroxylacyl-ACP dehydratase